MLNELYIHVKILFKITVCGPLSFFVDILSDALAFVHTQDIFCHSLAVLVQGSVDLIEWIGMCSVVLCLPEEQGLVIFFFYIFLYNLQEKVDKYKVFLGIVLNVVYYY